MLCRASRAEAGKGCLISLDYKVRGRYGSSLCTGLPAPAKVHFPAPQEATLPGCRPQPGTRGSVRMDGVGSTIGRTAPGKRVARQAEADDGKDAPSRNPEPARAAR